MRTFFTSLVFFISLYSCKSPTYHELFLPFESDTTYTDIRMEALNLLTDKLEIPRLDKGINGFEMRIWTPRNEDDDLNLFIIKYSGEMWSYTSMNIALTQPARQKNDSIPPMLRVQVDSLRKSEVRPKYNEHQLINSIITLDLQNGPTQEVWESDLSYDTDNHFAYTFEIGNESSYRMITFVCARRKGGQTEYDKTVIDFLRLLKRNFSLEFEDCIINSL